MNTKIIPVIHYFDRDQVLQNAAIAHDVGCNGVFVIDMTADDEDTLQAAGAVKIAYPDLLVGVNLLSEHPTIALQKSIEANLDMTWVDEQVTHSQNEVTIRASLMRQTLNRAPDHLVFVGVAFKYQPHEPDPVRAAKKAINFNFIPTTSGPDTGVPADIAHVTKIRTGIGPHTPLAIASGITPENVKDFAPHLSHILVSTGVSSDFHTLDKDKLLTLRTAILKLDYGLDQ